MNQTPPCKGTRFSWKRRMQSFGPALQGIRYFFRTEHNAQVHAGASLLLIFLSVTFSISNTEAIALCLAAGFVWVTELLNTAIEKTMDFITLKREPAVKYIKDLAAAAVLVAVLTAVGVGAFVFVPKIWELWKG